MNYSVNNILISRKEYSQDGELKSNDCKCGFIRSFKKRLYYSLYFFCLLFINLFFVHNSFVRFLIPCRFFSLVVGCLILACLSVDTYLSVAAQSPPNVLPKSSVLIAFYILKIYLPYSLYSLNSFFNSIKEIPQLLPRSPPISKTLQTI